FSQITPHVETKPARVLRLTAPAERHVLLRDTEVQVATPFQIVPGTVAPSSGAATLRHRMATSLLATTLQSAALRRATRPGARLARRLGLDDGEELVRRVDAGEVSPAPPKQTPPGLVTTDDV